MNEFSYYRLISGNEHFYTSILSYNVTGHDEADSVIVAQHAVDEGILDKEMKHSVEVVRISIDEYDLCTEFERLESERHALMDIAESLNDMLSSAKMDWAEFKRLSKALNFISNG